MFFPRELILFFYVAPCLTLFHSMPDQISRIWEKTGLWATTLPEFAKPARFSPEVGTFRTESTFMAPVKYQNLILVTLSAGQLIHSRIRPSQVKLILFPKQRAKPAASRTRTCTSAAVCIASGECPSRF